MPNKKYTVFVSSTYEDLQEERKKVMEALLQMNCFPVGMEYFNASDDSQWAVIKQLIDECDYYVLILAGRYGSVEEESGKSYTQKEYEYAKSIHVPVLSFVHKNINNLPQGRCESDQEKKDKLEAFKETVQKKLCKFWNTSDDLASQVVLSLNSAITSFPRTGWIRAEGLTSEESAKEILRLKNEIEKLKESLQAIESEDPKDTADLCQGDDRVKLNYKYYYGGWHYISFSTTWRAIISCLSPLMISEASENELKKALVDFAQDSEKKDYNRLEVLMEDFQTIKVQLITLHIIKESIKKRPVHDNQTYWTLTPYGNRLVMKEKALRKKIVDANNDI